MTTAGEKMFQLGIPNPDQDWKDEVQRYGKIIAEKAVSATPTELIRYQAQMYASLGLTVLPTVRGNKHCTVKDWNKLDASIALDKVNEEKYPTGLVIRCGLDSNLICIDADLKEISGVEVIHRWEEKHGALNTLTATSPSGGKHYFFRYDKRLSKSDTCCFRDLEGNKAPIDIKSNGGTVTVFPTETKKGSYRWDNWGTPPAPLPEWILSYLIEKKKRGRPKKVVTELQPRGWSWLKWTEKHLYLISPDKVDDYASWLKVAMAFRNSFVELEDEAWEILDRWSATGRGYDSKKNREIWDGLVPNSRDDQITSGTIFYWAKEANPEAYAELHAPPEIKPEENYYLKDLVDEILKDQVFESRKEAELWLRKRAGKVLRVLCTASIQIISKVSEDDPYHTNSYMAFSNGRAKLQLAYKTLVDGVEEIAHLRLLDYMLASRHLLVSRVLNRPFHQWEKDPYLPRKGDFNVFSGYPVKRVPYDPNDWRLVALINHTRMLMDDDQFSNWFFKLEAFSKQYPRERPGVMVILQGPSGAGKSMLTNFLGRAIHGNAYFPGQGLNNISKWSYSLNGIKMVILEELSSVSDEGSWKGTANTFKELVSGERIKLERKGIECEITMENYTHWIGVTNHVKCLPFDDEGVRRRCAPIACKNVCQGNKEYIQYMLRVFQDPETANIYFSWLLDMDVSGFNPQLEKPETELFHRMTRLSGSYHPVDTFMEEIRTGELELDSTIFRLDKNHPEGVWMSGEVYNVFRVWKESNGYTKGITKIGFFGDLKLTGPKKERKMIGGERKQWYMVAVSQVHPSYLK